MTDSLDRHPHLSTPSAPCLPDTASLRLRGPADVIDAVPYLLGFHPRESLVLVGVDGAGPGGRRSGTRVGVVARVDLADCGLSGLLPRTVAAIVRPDTTGVIAVVFRDAEPEIDPGLCDAITKCVAERAAHLLDVLVVGAHRWVSAVCDDPAACESGGGLRDDGVPSPTALAATVAGMVARPGRQDVIGLLEPAPGRHALLPALQAAAAIRAELGPAAVQRRRRGDVRALYAATRTLPVLEDRQLIEFGVALTDQRIRDACWLAAEAGRIDGDGLWRELARRLPPPYDAAPLFLTGWDQWRRGNGTLAVAAAERALRSEPSYAAAELLLSAVHEGLDPFRTPRLRRGA